MLIKQNINEFISQADAARDAKKLESSKGYVCKGLILLTPLPLYPQEQIDWINEQMKKRKLIKSLRHNMKKLIAAADNQFYSSKHIQKPKNCMKELRE